METDADIIFMRMALREALEAADGGEVPVGAVIVHKGRVIGKAHNQVELLRDATAHAEMLALTQASAALGDWRLQDTVMYVTKEPCPMCAGALVLSRVGKLVFGTADPERGGVVSLFRIADNPSLNHRVETVQGVLAEECRAVIKDFFRARRMEPDNDKTRNSNSSSPGLLNPEP